MKTLATFLLIFAGGELLAQANTQSGIYGAANSAKAGTISLDWVIGSLVPDRLAAFPVRLISFEGKRNNAGGADLYWKTAEETSNQGFEVQKSADGRMFQKLGWVDGSNTDAEKAYTFTDPALTNTSYYRLKQINYDGSFTISRVIVVIPENESIDHLLAFPVPSEDGRVSITLPEKTQMLNLSDVKGISLLNKTLPPDKTTIYLPASGMYLLHVRTKAESKTIKLLRK
ncbi:T9SS type A sorting domain-containing protein [Dyadobacter sandarakinus]|uniref:T9SS type A sorting domain-containing protein n=1 Tax=Dyadobacter sandarakinus TaxID=2747268 RepID=A0ABX7I0V6_9BACT|nr:T9SS type A sorting domain-containing protein [Dyadobacter sandarakinus]QRQ99680.1 T9SS type A sorting domain-containing protein [Dyadobacter sandarakinus]